MELNIRYDLFKYNGVLVRYTVNNNTISEVLIEGKIEKPDRKFIYKLLDEIWKRASKKADIKQIVTCSKLGKYVAFSKKVGVVTFSLASEASTYYLVSEEAMERVRELAYS